MKVYQFFIIYMLVLKTVQSIDMYCDYRVRYYPYVSRVEESTVTSLNVLEKNQQITWTSSCSYYNDAVYIESLKVKYLPQGFDDRIGKNIKVLTVISSGLQEINQTDLLQFEQLIVLNLTDNNLEIIEENLFKNNPKLQLIDLSKNPLKTVASNAFFNFLTMLKAVNFTSCSCVNGKASNQIEIDELFYYGECSKYQTDVKKSNLDATSKLLFISMKKYSEYEKASVMLKCVNTKSTTCLAVLEVKTPNSDLIKNVSKFFVKFKNFFN